LAADNVTALLGEPTTDGLCDLTLDDQAAVIHDTTMNLPEVPWDEVVRYYQLIPQITEWIKAVEGHVEGKLLRGEGTHPAIKVVRGRPGNRAWADESSASAFLLTEDLHGAEVFKEVLLSVAQTEKALKKTNPELWESVQQWVGRSEGKLTVVPVSDKREAEIVESPLAMLESEIVEEELTEEELRLLLRYG
jgi:hypothetical protein